MCGCNHGLDRHYLDYAGPGVAGGIPAKCLEEGCGCLLYSPQDRIRPGGWSNAFPQSSSVWPGRMTGSGDLP